MTAAGGMGGGAGASLPISGMGGTPGSVRTYFPFPNIGKGRPGVGEVGTTVYSVPEGTLAYWEKRFAAKKLKSHLNFPGTLPHLEADETRLQELIYNLLDSAVKYSNPGGTVFLRAESEDDSVRISVAATPVSRP